MGSLLLSTVFGPMQNMIGVLRGILNFHEWCIFKDNILLQFVLINIFMDKIMNFMANIKITKVTQLK